MANKGHALARDELIRVLTAYTGITTADGEVVDEHGTTLVDTNLMGRNDFVKEKTILIGSGDAKDEDKGAVSFNPLNGVITVQGPGFSAQIKAGTIYRIINISSIEIDVANIDTKIGTNTDPAGTDTLFAWMLNLFGGIHGISTEGTYDLPNDVVENTAFTITPTGTQRISTIMLDLSNLVQNADIRVKYDMHGDGAPHPTMETFNWTTGMDDIVYFREISGQRAVEVTVQSIIAQGAIVAIDYEYVLG